MAGSYTQAEAQKPMENYNEAMKELPFGKGMEPNPKSLQPDGDVSNSTPDSSPPAPIASQPCKKTL